MWEASAETARSSLALIKVLTEVVNFLSPEIRNICCMEKIILTLCLMDQPNVNGILNTSLFYKESGPSG